jgi:NAD(P)-dependent dehydrogenase (short-subunit alcohol dehydrogenase family)
VFGAEGTAEVWPYDQAEALHQEPRLYGPQRIRSNAVAPSPTVTGIEGAMKSALAAERIGPIMRAVLSAPAPAEHWRRPSPGCSATLTE